jgi:cardiolipin synthase
VEKQDDTVAVGHQVLTIPNVISIIRLAGVPLFLWLVLVPEADGWALAVLFVSGVSDYADGYLARRLNQTSKVGEILDPVADRLYILSTVIGLAARGIIPWWLALLLPARDASGTLPLLAKVFGWAFAIWGTGLYWWAGLLYAWQVRKLLADHDRRAPALDGG